MGLRSWLTGRCRLDRDDEDVQDEIRAHLAIAAREKIADGADETAARYAALKEFGNVTMTVEATRRVWTPRWVEASRDLINDVRYAIRALARHPGFSLTVTVVLTLGIGLNAAVFTFVKSLALAPLSGVSRSAQLSVVHRETTSGRALRLSYPDYLTLRDHTQAFVELFGTTVAAVGLGRDRDSRSLWSELVTGNYFQALGVGAQVGRTLLPSDETASGGHPVAVISDGLWRRDFAADPDIAGTTIEINNQPLTIVGVADPAFHGTIVSYDVEVFVPITMGPQLGFGFVSRETTPSGILADRTALVFMPQGFLRPESTRAAAALELETLWATLAAERPIADSGERLRIVPFLRSPGSGQTYMLPTVTTLGVMGVLVLLIACANIAGLVLVRGVSRRGEIAMRLALGATRARIVRLLVIENLALALPGAALGVLLASRGISVMTNYADWLASPQRLHLNVGVDSLVIGFAVVVACGCALVFGFLPALRTSRVNLAGGMSDISTRVVVHGRLRAGLVVAQVAVSVLLLVGASLVSRSLDAAKNAHPGFDAGQVAAIELDLKQNGYDEPRGRAFYRRLLDAARSSAGTESATLAAYIPLNFLDTRAQQVEVAGYQPQRGEDLSFLSNAVASDYFRTLQISLLAGRPFEDRDDETAAPVAIVNGVFADRFWGGAAGSIGKQLRGADGHWRTVIGVAADVKYIRINEAPRPYIYLPYLQAYRPTMTLHTRGPAPPDVLVKEARETVAALDPDLPVLSAKPLRDHATGALILLNFAATMLLVFGTAGMLLAALGTFGLVSYSVTQSTREIGIRLALGASARSIVRVFLARGLRLGAVGAALGIVAAIGISRLLRNLLFGVSGTDVASFALALAIVLGGVIVATVLPAWRAARTNPMNALRHQ